MYANAGRQIARSALSSERNRRCSSSGGSGRKGDILPSFAIPLLPVPTKDAFLQVSWKRKEILSSLARDVSKIEFFSTSREWEKYFGNERWKWTDVTEDD